MARPPKPIGALGAAVVLALSAAACLPLPWASPPVSASFGPEVRATIDRSEDAPAGERVDVLGASYRFGAHPLGLVRSLEDRAFDFAMGWQLLTGDELVRANGGPYVEVMWFFHRDHVIYEYGSGERVRFRVGAGGQLRLHDIDAPHLGAALQLNAEWVTFVAGSAAECERSGRTTACYLGVGHGEASAGFFLDAAVADVGTRRLFTTTGGIILRLPASAGAALFIFL